MATVPVESGSLGELLETRKRRRFVGRAAELELFTTALTSAEPAFSVLYVHGPGGIGKTRLLEAFEDLAAEAGATAVSIDGRDLQPAPQAVLDALAGHLDAPSGVGRLVLLVDSYERLAVLDDWLRAKLLPRLPSTALTVLAGRDPPAPEWRADAAWRDLLRVISLRNWDWEESRRYLDAAAVDPALHARVIDCTHGHPFGLSLLADVANRGGGAAFDPLAPDLVAILLRRFVAVLPSPLHRQALEVCALARVTTEALLREALGLDDAHELFSWLRGLSFVECAPDGLLPHDLARDALDLDLRWRDLDGYKRRFRAVRDHIHRRLVSTRGHEQQVALFDEKFMFRNLPGILSPVDWQSWGRQYAEPARPGDRAAALELVRDWEGDESATIAERWWDLQPEGFFVLRDPDASVRGVVGLLNLTRAGGQDIAADPGAAAAWQHAQRHAAPRPGEVVLQTRFVLERDAYQRPSATLNTVPILTLQRYLNIPALAWDYLTLAEPDRWNEYFAVADLPRAGDADFEVGGRRYGLFAHDFRAVGVDAWLELVTERALSQDFTLPAPIRAPLLMLSQHQFGEAVRQGLRDLHRPDLLARNPLLRSRVLRDRAGHDEPDGTALAALLRAAVATLATHPRDDKLLRAVDRTYQRPAATQERAAAVLGLPFGTYRRHLTQGVTRVVCWLWDRDVYGGAEQRAEQD